MLYRLPLQSKKGIGFLGHNKFGNKVDIAKAQCFLNEYFFPLSIKDKYNRYTSITDVDTGIQIRHNLWSQFGEHEHKSS